MKVENAQIEWEPGTPDGVLVFERKYDGNRRVIRASNAPRYPMSGGAADSERASLTGKPALVALLADFHTLVVRDGIDPQAAHREFLKIDEYRRVISPDIEGAE